MKELKKMRWLMIVLKIFSPLTFITFTASALLISNRTISQRSLKPRWCG
ncbi:MAG: hypothetical protein QXJ75_01680 [Candidatus Bathyarchaeia archaeon]